MNIINILIVVVLTASLVILYKYYTTKALKSPKSKEQKRAEIIDEYKIKLNNTLYPLNNNPSNQVAIKTKLLKEFSLELSKNIFFDNSEIREIIQELANYTPKST